MTSAMSTRRLMCLCACLLGMWFQLRAQDSRLHAANMPEQVASVMSVQMEAWNQGDLEGFMEGYWQSDSLLFVAKSGITRGHSATLERYQHGYPTQADMGTLTFRNECWTRISRRSGLLVGGWHLRKTGQPDAQGMYTLLWRRIRGEWVIVADHSS